MFRKGGLLRHNGNLPTILNPAWSFVAARHQRKRHNPFAACATARNSARPLLIVSSHSVAGSES